MARIVYQRCAPCHREGEATPMPLTSYRAVRPYAKGIRDELLAGTMPPWKADPAHGRFANDARLPEAERATILRWVQAGAPEGDRARAPRPPRFVSGWNIGRPDVALGPPVPIDVPADGVLENKYVTVPTGFTQDRWVTAIELRPEARSVVHHVTVFLKMARPPDRGPGVPCAAAAHAEQFLARPPAPTAREYLFSWTPGAQPFRSRAGEARRIPAGAELVFELHYTPDGTARRDRTRLGMVFAPGPPRREVRTLTIYNDQFEIPPGAPAHPVSACFHFARPIALEAIKAHMHLRGKDVRFDLVSPDGQRETLLAIPRWDFDWQLTYVLAEPRVIAVGAHLELQAHFDNSGTNPRNPDPTRTVVWDEQSTGEMLAGMLTYVPLPPAPASPGDR